MLPRDLIAQPVVTECKQKIASWLKNSAERVPRSPGLAIIQVGKDPASTKYIQRKQKFCHELLLASRHLAVEETSDPASLFQLIKRLNRDNGIDGILLQLPLPPSWRSLTQAFIETIDPDKDVDGLTLAQRNRLTERDEHRLLPCTPKGILSLLHYYHVPVSGKDVLIIGRSRLVGFPLMLLMNQLDATVTLAHRKTHRLAEKVHAADIVIAAMGSPHAIQQAWFKKGSIAIDVGINVQGSHLLGDIEPRSSTSNVRAQTPVPGGIGPMTVLSLIENCCEAFAWKYGLTAPTGASA